MLFYAVQTAAKQSNSELSRAIKTANGRFGHNSQAPTHEEFLSVSDVENLLNLQPDTLIATTIGNLPQL